jgi:hypothetical protein
VETHTDFHHQGVVHLFARIEWHVQICQLICWVQNQLSEVLSLKVRQTRKAQFHKLSFGEGVNACWSHSFAEIYVKCIQKLAFSKLDEAFVGNCVFHVIGRKFLELGFILNESLNGWLFDLAAKRNIDGLQELAWNSQLYENFIGDGNSSKVQLFNIGS